MGRTPAALALAISVVILSAGVSGSESLLPVPHGWRVPAASEVGAGRLANAMGRGHLTVEGDFNGDGQMDRARLLVKRGGHRFGLFVFLSSRTGTPKTCLLHEDNIELLKRIGIQLVKPGKYETLAARSTRTLVGITTCRLFTWHMMRSITFSRKARKAIFTGTIRPKGLT